MKKDDKAALFALKKLSEYCENTVCTECIFSKNTRKSIRCMIAQLHPIQYDMIMRYFEE